MEELDLVDIWRLQNPDKKIYSWVRKKPNSNEVSASRIDFALINAGLVNFIEKNQLRIWIQN